MIKLVFCCHRNPALSVEEFHRSWREDHGPLVRSVREQLPNMLRYVQSHTVAPEANATIRASRGTAEPYDGITEVWFADLASLGSDEAGALDAGRRLLEDERRLLDLPRCSVFLTEEHEVF